MNSITKRWMRGSLFFTLAVVLIAEGIFLYYMIAGYYNNASAAILNQFHTIRSQLSLFSSSNAEEQGMQLYRTVEQFEEKTRYELMLVDIGGNIVLTSSGVLPSQAAVAPDIDDVLQSGGEESGYYMGKNENGENIMAITQLTPYASGGVVAMRLVTSMTQINESIRNLVITSMMLLLVIVMASVVSGVYFIRSIVIPLQKVEVTAAKIAEGDFDTRIDNQSNDEIGSLCTTINHMAEELGRTERMKNEFISSVSHELRTPLTSIKGWTETVGRFQDPDDPSFRRGVEIIAGEADRLYDMVEELLDFSRMQNGLELKPELLDLTAEVEEAVLLEGQRAYNLGIEMEFFAPELPVPVMAEGRRVRQVLVNVMDNALKYSPKGSTVHIVLEQNEAEAFVIIQDEGPGIAPDDLENVKQKFYKGKGAKRGSGIGLAVADEIMAAHNGALQIESETGQGTKVTLSFPLHFKQTQKKPKEPEKTNVRTEETS